MCQADSTWSDSTPLCQRTQAMCPSLEQRELAQLVVTASSDDFSIIAVYSAEPSVSAEPTSHS